MAGSLNKVLLIVVWAQILRLSKWCKSVARLSSQQVNPGKIKKYMKEKKKLSGTV